jgi:hypothetical protein
VRIGGALDDTLTAFIPYFEGEVVGTDNHGAVYVGAGRGLYKLRKDAVLGTVTRTQKW